MLALAPIIRSGFLSAARAMDEAARNRPAVNSFFGMVVYSILTPQCGKGIKTLFNPGLKARGRSRMRHRSSVIRTMATFQVLLVGDTTPCQV